MAGSLVGTAAALIVLPTSSLTVGIVGVTIAFMPSAALAGTGLAVTLVVGVLAGVVPAWQAAWAEIVASLRFV